MDTVLETARWWQSIAEQRMRAYRAFGNSNKGYENLDELRKSAPNASNSEDGYVNLGIVIQTMLLIVRLAEAEVIVKQKAKEVFLKLLAKQKSKHKDWSDVRSQTLPSDKSDIRNEVKVE